MLCIQTSLFLISLYPCYQQRYNGSIKYLIEHKISGFNAGLSFFMQFGKG